MNMTISHRSGRCASPCPWSPTPLQVVANNDSVPGRALEGQIRPYRSGFVPRPRVTSRLELPRLRVLLPDSSGAMKAETALAIWLIAKDDQMARVIIDVSREHATGDEECTRTFEMIDIVHCLARLPHASARKRRVELANSRNTSSPATPRLHPWLTALRKLEAIGFSRWTGSVHWRLTRGPVPGTLYSILWTVRPLTL